MIPVTMTEHKRLKALNRHKRIVRKRNINRNLPAWKRKPAEHTNVSFGHKRAYRLYYI